jgi:hypothetical protein
MSTSYRYEINKGKPDPSALRMQQTAQVRFNKIEIRLFSVKLEWRIIFQTTTTIGEVRSFEYDGFWDEYFRDKYQQFKANWAEQSAWSNIALRESTVNKQREQELILLRKAHLTVCFSFEICL